MTRTLAHLPLLLAQADPAQQTAKTLRELTIGESIAFAGILGIIVAGIAGALKLWSAIHKMKHERHEDLAEEVRNILAEQEVAKKVAIQSPLKTEPHDAPTPLSKHRELAQKLEIHIERTDRTFAELFTDQKRLATMVAEVRTKTDLTHAQLQNVDNKIDRILQNFPRSRP